MARNIAFEDLATVVYAWVDDGFQAHAAGGRQGLAGTKPRFSDSEVITLLRLMDCLPFPGETQFLNFVRANHAVPLSAAAQPEPVQPPGPAAVALGRGQRSIQGGRAAVRHALYMAALSVIRQEGIHQHFYQSLRQRGKTGKVALAAVMRKLLLHLNAVAR